MTSLKNKKGFTLIELLVVIGVISLLSSMIFASLSVARNKAIDAKKQQDLASVRTALSLFHSTRGAMPKNYNKDGTFDPAGGGNLLAIEDMDHPNDASTNESGRAYNASMQELVTANVIAEIPRSGGGSPFSYYNYNHGGSSGFALLFTELQTNPNAVGTCPAFYVLRSDSIELWQMMYPGVDPNLYYQQTCLGPGIKPLSCTYFEYEPMCGPGKYCICTTY